MSPGRRVIPTGQEELLRRMLDPPEGLPGGWQFVHAAVEGGGVEARYRHGNDVAVVRLVPAGDAREGALRTGSFAIDAAPRLPSELVKALEVSVLAREHRIRWSEPPPPEIDPGWCALDAGVTRALRKRLRPDDADSVERSQRDRGLSVLRLDSETADDRIVLYIAKSEADAEWVRDAERQYLSAERAHDRRARLEELGWALGYPSCCVEAFVDRRLPTIARIAGSLVSGCFGSEAYRAARSAWVSVPRPRLNPFHRRTKRSLIDFDPCRYNCEKALDFAEHVADACAKIDREWLKQADHTLGAPIVIAPNGALAEVTIERRIEPMRIIAARSLDAGGAPSAQEAQLIGAEIREDGLLVGDAIGWSLLIDFGRRSRR